MFGGAMLTWRDVLQHPGAGFILLSLGVAVTALGVLSLKGARIRNCPPHRAHLTVTSMGDGPTNAEICRMVRKAGFKISSVALSYDQGRKMDMEVEWYGRGQAERTPPLVEQMAVRKGLTQVDWRPVSAEPLYE